MCVVVAMGRVFENLKWFTSFNDVSGKVRHFYHSEKNAVVSNNTSIESTDMVGKHLSDSPSLFALNTSNFSKKYEKLAVEAHILQLILKNVVSVFQWAYTIFVDANRNLLK